MNYSEFICSVLTKLCEADRDLKNQNLNNYTSIIIEFPAVAVDLLHAFGMGGSLCPEILVQQVKGFITLVSEEFSKSIARLMDADLDFQIQNGT